MLTLYHSNQLDLLKTLMAELIVRDPLVDPFQHEVVLVQSQGMEQWLKIELAQTIGVVANIDFLLPASFFWQQLSQLLPNIPKEDLFSRAVMNWHCMKLLPRLLEKPEFTTLRDYLKADQQENKQYQLAVRIAQLFDNYLIYRADWLLLWQNNQWPKALPKSEMWQAILWRHLVEEVAQQEAFDIKRAELYVEFMEQLNNREVLPTLCPKRIFLFGISALPPLYLQMLQALGQHIDVHIMVLNPCRYYWSDLRNQVSLLQQSHKKQLTEEFSQMKSITLAESFSHEDLALTVGNPLLASFGKQGREYLSLLAELEKSNDIEAFVDVPQGNLLQRIQHDILELIDSTQELTERHRLALDDDSLQIYACHSMQREVEVLHDALLTQLKKNPTLNPRDILILVPDITHYTPYINAVFGQSSVTLPYAISDRQIRELHPLFTTFLSLLHMDEGRWEAEEILTLLSVSLLAEKFALSEEEIKRLRHWVGEAGVRWGLDNKHVESLALPVTDQHTWRFGLTRMLLGYAMSSQDGTWQNVLPYDGSRGLAAELIGKLASFLERLSYWREQLQQPHTFTEWQPICAEMLEDFFVCTPQHEALLLLLKQEWQHCIKAGKLADYTEVVPLPLLRKELSFRLENKPVSQSFLAGAINFCAFIPMRSIPFKVIGLLGMNEGSYPHVGIPLSFDLMAQKPRRGDRNRRDDERYLFLEALLSAEQNFYLSYISKTIHDNSELQPSVVLSDLLEYVVQSHQLENECESELELITSNVKKHLIRQQSRMPFDERNFDIKSGSLSYAKEWLAVAQKVDFPASPFVVPLAKTSLNIIELNRLQQFYRHPIRAFFQQRLKVYFDSYEEELPGYEPFDLTGLARYRMKNKLLNRLIESPEDLGTLYHTYKSAGALPYANFGLAVWQKESQIIQTLADTIRQERHPVESQEVLLDVNGIKLTGWLHTLQTDGILRWRAGELSILDGITLWIEHLIYCCIIGEGESRMHGVKGKSWRFEALSRADAYAELQLLVQGYIQGLNEPLLLLPKSSWGWLTKSYCNETQTVDWCAEKQQLAHEAFKQIWRGSSYQSGEVSDAYYQRLFRLNMPLDEERVFRQAERYLLPIAQHTIGLF